MIKVLINATPLGNDNAIRGVGVYTRLLIDHLRRVKDVEVFTFQSPDKTQPQPDIIHYPWFDLFFNTLPLFHRYPVIVTVHDVIPLIFPKQYLPGVKGKIKFYQQRLALSKVAGIITDSQSSKNDIHQYLKIKLNKIFVVPLAADPALTAVDLKQAKKISRHLHLPAKFILYVGDINYNKNLPQLIKSLKYLPDDIHLVLVGKNFKSQSIPEWQWIETQIALSDVADRIKFIPDLDKTALNQLSAIYSQALCYIQPSLYEGFGLPVLEAMTCKTPVVCSQNSSLIEVGSTFVLYCQPTAEDMAEKITTIMNWSESKRRSFLQAAWKWSQSFSWKKTAQQTAEVYQQIVNSQ